MPQQTESSPHFPVCLKMLAVADGFARSSGTLADPALTWPSAGPRIAEQADFLVVLAAGLTDLHASYLTLPLSRADNNDHTVESRLAQLQVVTAAARNSLLATRAGDPEETESLVQQAKSVTAAWELLVTASVDLIDCAERVGSAAGRYRAYPVPRLDHPLSPEQLHCLRLIASGAVTVDDAGQPWVGLSKDVVRVSVIRGLDRRGLITAGPSMSWADEARVLPSPMGLLALAVSFSQPPVPGQTASPEPAAPAPEAAPGKGTRR